MADILTRDFESWSGWYTSNIDANSTMTPQSTTAAYAGTYGCRALMAGTTGSSNNCYGRLSFTSSTNIVEAEARINFQQLGGSGGLINGPLCFRIESPLYNYILRMYSDYGTWKLRLRRKDGTNGDATFTAPSTNTWHLVRLTYDNSVANPVAKLFIDGTEVASITDSTSGTSYTPGIVQLGWTEDGWNTDACEVYIDDLVVRDAISSSSTTHTHTATGGMTFAGSGVISKIAAVIAAGGLTLAGAGTTRYVKSYTASGGVSLSGSATISLIRAPATSGGLVFSGTPLVSLIRSFTPTNGLNFAGAATTSLVSSGTIHSHTATGGFTFSGSPVYSVIRGAIATGGVSFSGSGIGSYIPAGLPTRLSLTEIVSLQIRLDVKEITDSGTVSCLASDSGGTVVNFNKAFRDVTAIVLTVKQTTERIAIYDFVDTLNPTSFKILVFNTSGARVNETVSWIARGIG